MFGKNSPKDNVCFEKFVISVCASSNVVRIKVLTNNYYRLVILSPHRARQLCRTEILHPLGNPVTVAVLMTAIKETHCTFNRRFNISETKDGWGRTD